MKRNQKGFTLAELLIVVAIIAVLVAISIPIFANQLEKSRESTDASNIRAAYAEVAAAGLSDPSQDHTAQVTLIQQVSDWQNTGISSIAGVAINQIKSSGTVEVKYTANGSVSIDGKAVTSSFMTSS